MTGLITSPGGQRGDPETVSNRSNPVSQAGPETGVVLPPTAMLENAEAIRSQLTDVSTAGVSVAIDLSAVMQADLSLVQLVLALHRDAALQGRAVRLAGQPSACVQRLFERAGLSLAELARGMAPPGAPERGA